MICDDCTKKDVCRLREPCTNLENDLAHTKIEDAITLTVKCKHKETRAYTGIRDIGLGTLPWKEHNPPKIYEPLKTGVKKITWSEIT